MNISSFQYVFLSWRLFIFTSDTNITLQNLTILPPPAVNISRVSYDELLKKKGSFILKNGPFSDWRQYCVALKTIKSSFWRC